MTAGFRDTGSARPDETESHYLKMLMDGIFGRDNFKNDIVWKRQNSHNNANRYSWVTDNILFYTKSSNYIWNKFIQGIQMPVE